MPDDAVQGQTPEKTGADEFRAQFKNPKQPSDFDSVEDFLRWATQTFDADLEYDKDNRDQAIEDVKFMVGDQWEDFVKQRRIEAKKPTLTFNRMPAFVGQVTGTRRMNETQIKVTPDDEAFKNSAKVREGLIRNIQKIAKADMAYNKALENCVITGVGNFEVATRYAHDDVFEQDIVILPINNPLSVVWDRRREDPTGADARHVFTVDTMTRDDFKREYPNATAGDPSTNLQQLGFDIDNQWLTNEEVRIVSMWRVRSRKRIIALLRDEDGTEDVEDVTDRDFDEFSDKIVTNSVGAPVMREADRLYAELYTFTATDLLEGPYELPIQRVPIFRVPGWEINVGDVQERFGLIRFMKDPQRLHNYWRSIIAEKLMNTPKGNWLATDEAVEGREKAFRESHLSDDPLLVWNGESGREPRRIEPAQVEAALINEANMAVNDLREISNLHEASLGQQSNEVSGRAILARQRVGEVGTVLYQDNLDAAIEQAGIVINQLIPAIYDTTRTIKILGEEGEDLGPVVINDDTNENAVDITKGKYSVTSTTGPSFVTKRVEAAESMLNMVNAMPDTLSVAADKIVEAQDWPGSEEIARRLRLRLPPGMLAEKDMTQEQIAAARAASEQAQLEQQKRDAALAAEIREKEARANQADALALQAQAQASTAFDKVDIDAFKAVADVEDTRIKQVLDALQAFQNTSTNPTGDTNG